MCRVGFLELDGVNSSIAKEIIMIRKLGMALISLVGEVNV